MPRLYFVPDDEVLQARNDCLNPATGNAYINNGFVSMCFSEMRELRFRKGGSVALAMVAKDGSSMSLLEPLDCGGRWSTGGRGSRS